MLPKKRIQFIFTVIHSTLLQLMAVIFLSQRSGLKQRSWLLRVRLGILNLLLPLGIGQCIVIGGIIP